MACEYLEMAGKFNYMRHLNDNPAYYLSDRPLIGTSRLAVPYSSSDMFPPVVALRQRQDNFDHRQNASVSGLSQQRFHNDYAVKQFPGRHQHSPETPLEIHATSYHHHHHHQQQQHAPATSGSIGRDHDVITVVGVGHRAQLQPPDHNHNDNISGDDDDLSDADKMSWCGENEFDFNSDANRKWQQYVESDNNTKSHPVTSRHHRLSREQESTNPRLLGTIGLSPRNSKPGPPQIRKGRSTESQLSVPADQHQLPPLTDSHLLHRLQRPIIHPIIQNATDNATGDICALQSFDVRSVAIPLTDRVQKVHYPATAANFTDKKYPKQTSYSGEQSSTSNGHDFDGIERKLSSDSYQPPSSGSVISRRLATDDSSDDDVTSQPPILSVRIEIKRPDQRRTVLATSNESIGCEYIDHLTPTDRGRADNAAVEGPPYEANSKNKISIRGTANGERYISVDGHGKMMVVDQSSYENFARRRPQVIQRVGTTSSVTALNATGSSSFGNAESIATGSRKQNPKKKIYDGITNVTR